MPANGQPKAEPRNPAALARRDRAHPRGAGHLGQRAARGGGPRDRLARVGAASRPLMCVGAAFMVGFLIAHRR